MLEDQLAQARGNGRVVARITKMLLEGSPDDNQAVTLLIVDDDRAFREAVAGAFARRGYTVRLAANCHEARGVSAAFKPERALVDWRLPDGSGLEVLDELRRVDSQTAVVLLSGQVGAATAREALQRGAVACLTKPVEPAEIEAAFARAAEAAARFTALTPAILSTTVEECGGDLTEAARRLGVHRRALLRRLTAMT